MRLCVRLSVLVGCLVLMAMALIYLRTDTVRAGNRLHALFNEKRAMEKSCCRLEMSIAGLKNQERLRQHAADLLQAEDSGPEPAAPGRAPATPAADPPRVVQRNRPAGR
jgi:cell division protein FtsL